MTNKKIISNVHRPDIAWLVLKGLKKLIYPYLIDYNKTRRFIIFHFCLSPERNYMWDVREVCFIKYYNMYMAKKSAK